MAEDAVAYATPNGSGASACTQADPCSIIHAFAVTDAARHTVKLAPGDYVASISVTNKSVSVHGTGAQITPPSASTVLFSITDTASLELLQLKIRVRNGANAVDCRGSVASIRLDEVEVDADQTAILSECMGTISRSHLHIENATGGAAVFAVSGTLTLDRTLIDGGGGVANAKAIVTLSNSIITARNGGANSAFVFVNSGSSAGPIFVRFSSVMNTPVKCNDMVRCTGTAFGLCFENSIVANFTGGAPSDTVTGAGCSASYSIVFPQATSLSGANNQIGVNPDVLDPINGDFHLKPGSPAVDAADPAAAESTDFDGLSRPQGTGRDIGAYELKP